MPAWPATLPDPLLAGYALAAPAFAARTATESGAARQRRRFSALPDRVTVSWAFTDAQYQAFRDWHADTLADGLLAFDIALDVGDDPETVSAKFAGDFNAALEGQMRWRVSAELLVTGFTTLSAEEVEVAAAWLPADLREAAPLLHAWLHITLPAANYW